MFERSKIKRLISALSIENSEAEQASLVRQISKFGKMAFPYAAEAFKQRRLGSDLAKTIMTKTYHKPHIDILINLIGDQYEQVRSTAKDIIRNNSNDDVLEYLINNLQNPNPYIKAGSVELISLSKGQTHILKLVSLFNSADSNLKKSIITIISASVKCNASIKLLISSLKDKDWSVRIRAVKAISKLNDRQFVDPLIEVLSEGDHQMQLNALNALNALGEKKIAPFVLKLLASEDMIVRQKAVDCLCKLGDSRIIPGLLNMMKDGDVNVRRCVVDILNSMKDPSTGSELVRAMKDSDWWVRDVATEALAEIKGENIVRIISAMLKDDDENIRRSAVHFFDKLNDPIAVEPLIGILNDKDWWVREKTVGVLGRLKDPRAIEPISRLIDDRDVKLSVPKALGEIGGEEAIELLFKFLANDDKQVKIETIRAFGMLNDAKVIDKLEALLRDHDEDISNEAATIMTEITGRVYKPVTANKEKEKGRGLNFFSDISSVEEGSILTEAILVVDLCNSTGIAAKYGDQFSLNMTKVFTEKARVLADRESYQYIKSTGDGFLITFPMVGNAVLFAVGLLKDIREYNSNVEESMAIDLRFAINFGETRVDAKGDRLGVATNMTFRVEGVKAEDLIEIEGGIKASEMPKKNRILVTENVIDDLFDMKNIETTFMGLFNLKGISGLHRIYKIEEIF